MDPAALLDKLLPPREDCQARALDLRAAHPSAIVTAIADAAIKASRRRAATVGAVSGLAANPFAMVPAAAVDMFAVLRTEAHLAGVIAALVDPESLNNEETFKTDILAVLFPAAISNALQSLGVQAGRQTSKVLVRKYVSKGVLKAVIRFAAKYLGIKLTQRAILTKVVSIVGAAIGGGWNWWEVRRLGRRTLAYHLGETIEVEPEPTEAEAGQGTS